jgi:ferrochelatase
VRDYLEEFLSDPRVVEIPRFLWLPLLYGVILRTRPARSAEKYAAIWTPEGSPLLVHTARQARLLQEATGLQVEYAMRYGEPTIAAALERLRGCSALTIVPLYPQYSASTTGSVLDVVGDKHRVVRAFHDHPAYIEALAANVRRHWEAKGRGAMLVMSFHGLPKRVVERGDPYEAQCKITATRLAQALGLRPDEWRLTFQSRFGPAAWLEPYTEPELVALARRGVERVDVVCPGFVADCLETLEEIGIGARAAFLGAGGKELQLIPCLNESPEWIAALSQIARG